MTLSNDITQVRGPAGLLHVDDGGTGPGIPVLLVHSFGGSTSQWAPQLDHLRRTRRAIAFDLRGHGQSESPSDGDYAVESLASDVGSVIRHLELELVVLVGHGLGAKAAIEYAAVAPEHVAGVLLVAPPPRVPADQAAGVIRSLEADYEKTSAGINERLLHGADESVRKLVLADAARVPSEDGLRVIRASFGHDPAPALGRYRGPILSVITPGGDTPNDLHHLVDGVDHVEMTGTSHWMQLDEPAAFNEILDRFLAGIDRVA